MNAANEVAPLLLIVSGPSGSGKSTLVQKILELPGTMPFGAAGDHAFGFVYYPAPSRDRGQREML